jgi:SAM-dependent methyltransferase
MQVIIQKLKKHFIKDRKQVQIPSHMMKEFTKGFYHDRAAKWHECITYQADAGIRKLSINSYLEKIERNDFNFGYSDITRRIYEIICELVETENLKVGADVGCETGAYPAIQIGAGIDTCDVFEIRDIEVDNERVHVQIIDLCNNSNLKPKYDLITCISTIEHIGLGRYGDPLDPFGDLKMMNSIRKIMRPGGFVIIVVPCHPDYEGHVVFNAHRLYTPYRIATLFEGFQVLDIPGVKESELNVGTFGGVPYIQQIRVIRKL